MTDTALALAAHDYLVAVDRLHEVHGNTDVHGYTGSGTPSLTPHCAWQCDATGVRYRPDATGLLRRIEGPPPHVVALTEYQSAEAALRVALHEMGVLL